MTTDIVIPNLRESINEGTITTWLVEAGAQVETDQPLLELETDKVTAELPSPCGGVVTEILFDAGADVDVGAVVGRIDPSAQASAGTASPAPGAAAAAATEGAPSNGGSSKVPLSPSVRRLIEEHGLNAHSIPASGKKGRLLKSDVESYLSSHSPAAPAEPEGERGEQSPLSTLAAMPAVDLAIEPLGPTPTGTAASAPAASAKAGGGGPRSTRRVPMTRLRRRIAERLKEVQNTAAILTTFNEVDMSAVMELRAQYKEAFLARHGVKLGFMSFFVKASIEALKEFPAINATIDGKDILYNDFYDVGVAVSSDRGLVVPVIRDADRLSFAEVESTISQLGAGAREGTLALDQLTGGTFTITNGGVFGSMLSTPILNPPQSGILGMHAIIRRPVAIGDQVEVRPVMFLALSYDHRIVDGSQAVRFLVKIKAILEDPARLLLEL